MVQVRGAAQHRGSILASDPASLGLNPGTAEIFSLLLGLWTVERSNPSNAYANDFANAVSGEGLSLSTTKTSSSLLMQ